MEAVSSKENYITKKESLCGRLGFWRKGMRTSEQAK